MPVVFMLAVAETLDILPATSWVALLACFEGVAGPAAGCSGAVVCVCLLTQAGSGGRVKTRAGSKGLLGCTPTTRSRAVLMAWRVWWVWLMMLMVLMVLKMLMRHKETGVARRNCDEISPATAPARSERVRHEALGPAAGIPPAQDIIFSILSHAHTHVHTDTHMHTQICTRRSMS